MLGPLPFPNTPTPNRFDFLILDFGCLLDFVLIQLFPIPLSFTWTLLVHCMCTTIINISYALSSLQFSLWCCPVNELLDSLSGMLKGKLQKVGNSCTAVLLLFQYHLESLHQNTEIILLEYKVSVKLYLDEKVNTISSVAHNTQSFLEKKKLLLIFTYECLQHIQIVSSFALLC